MREIDPNILKSISERWPDVVECSADLPDPYDAMSANVSFHRQESIPYYSWIASTLQPFLGNRTMELGAGIGMVSEHLKGLDLYIVTETWPPFLDELKEIIRHRKEVELRSLDVANIAEQREEFLALNLDSVFSTNLLEHLKNDVALLHNMAGILPEGGRVINLVPAYRSLYGDADKAVGHYRRYERKELAAKMVAAGLEVEKVFYFNQPGALAWFIVNKILRSNNTTQGQFQLFNLFVPLFRLMEQTLPAFTGASLIGVGIRRNQHYKRSQNCLSKIRMQPS